MKLVIHGEFGVNLDMIECVNYLDPPEILISLLGDPQGEPSVYLYGDEAEWWWARLQEEAALHAHKHQADLSYFEVPEP